MEQYLHNDFCQALDKAHTRAVSFFQAENEILGYTHCDVAQWLIARWDLPDSLSGPITCHHAPETGNDAESVAVCHLADWLCYDRTMTEPDGEIEPPLDERAFVTAGVGKDCLEAVRKRFCESQDSLSIFFGLLEDG
jgi:HD-like signal output (HDOD) protein